MGEVDRASSIRAAPGTNILRPYAILAAAFCLSFAASAQAGEVAGTVYDQRGVPAAGVVLALGDAQVVSAADGSYAFANVAPGEQAITAGNQRVAVTVAVAGPVRRNVFLLSRSARATVTGETAPSPENDAALAATFRLAEAMLQDTAGSSEGGGATAWRWNDLDG